MHGVGDEQAVDAFPSVGDHGLAAQDGGGKGVDDAHMLGVLAVGLHGDGDALRAGEGGRVDPGELGLGGLELVESNGAAVGDDGAAVANDLEAVGAGGVAGGGDEGAGRAVLVLDVGGHIVLDLDVVPLTKVHLDVDQLGHTADPLPEVEVVGALVEQDAAALARPGGAPGARVVVGLGAVPVGDDPARALEGAQLAGIHDLLDLAVDVVGALVEHHTELELGMAVGLGHHLAHLKGVDAGGLLAHDMESGLHGLDGVAGVVVVGDGDDDGVDEPRGDHLVGGVEKGGHFDVEVGVLGPALFDVALRPLQAGGVMVGDGGDYDLGAGAAGDVIEVAGAHVAHAEDAETYFVHGFVFLSGLCMGKASVFPEGKLQCTM